MEEIQTALTAQDVVTALDDAQADTRVRRTLMELAEPDFEVAMVGPDYVSTQLEFNGLDGFRDAWRDWTSPFETYRDRGRGDDRRRRPGRQPRRDDGHDANRRRGDHAPGAAVWTVADGRVRRVEFHLDRDAALRAAGLEPGSRP